MNFRNAEEKDVRLVYEWANDPVTRSQSFNSDPIPYDNHVVWFNSRLRDKDHMMLIFFNEENEAVGMVRFDNLEDHVVIGINIAPDQRGKSYASRILSMAMEDKKRGLPVYAYIKEDNIASVKSFSRAGFQFEKQLLYNNINSVLYIWK